MTIVRSIAHQCLDLQRFPETTQKKLESFLSTSTPSLTELSTILQTVLAPDVVNFVVFDAIDECTKDNRDLLLTVLARIIDSSTTTLRVFLATRNAAETQIKRHFKSFIHISMKSAQAQIDMKDYVQEILLEKVKNGELVIGNQGLITTIRDTLVNGTQGMFLWVSFQLSDICEEVCDEDFRATLDDLPKDPPETYERALSRIPEGARQQTVQKVYHWVAAAKRPLSLEELRGAISVEPAQTYLKTERFINNPEQLVQWCGNLVVLDEEDLVLQFVHRSVKQFLVSACRQSQFEAFHVNLTQADMQAGNFCVTYLNFVDFKTQLIKTPQIKLALNPKSIVRASLSTEPDSIGARLWPVVERTWKLRKGSCTEPQFDLTSCLYDLRLRSHFGSSQSPPNGFSFLGYAREHWLLHTTRLEKHNASIWSLCINLIWSESSLAPTPWEPKEWFSLDRAVIRWFVDHDHLPLLDLLLNTVPLNMWSASGAWGSLDAFPPTDEAFVRGSVASAELLALCKDVLHCLFQYALLRCKMQLLRLILSAGKFLGNDVELALYTAAINNNDNVVALLLLCKLSRKILLRAIDKAARHGNIKILRRLLAEQNTCEKIDDDLYGTVLQETATNGTVTNILSLPEAGICINEQDQQKNTPLRYASCAGNTPAVKMLIASGAKIDLRNMKDELAIHFPARNSHVGTVLLLLKLGADGTLQDHSGWTALANAIEFGHHDVEDIIKTYHSRPRLSAKTM